MLKHIVFWKNPNQDLEALHLIKQKLEALIGHIEGLIHLEVGVDVSKTANSYDLALYSEFTDHAALANYQAHPLHQAIVPLINAICTDRKVVDYFVNS